MTPRTLGGRVVGVVLVLSSVHAFALQRATSARQTIQIPQSDWLEVYLAHKIHEAIDNSPRRVVVVSHVEDLDVHILLRSAVGQSDIPESGRLAYIADVQRVVTDALTKQHLGDYT